jgi:hypothetical protein
MPRYIEEETFVNFVQEHFCNGCNNYNGVKCKSCSVDDAIGFVESAPTADVVPRIELDAMRAAANSYKMHYESAKSEVIDEFVKRLKDAPIRCAYPLFGLSTKAEIELHFNDIMLQVGDAIDRIAKEMKGGERDGREQDYKGS